MSIRNQQRRLQFADEFVDARLVEQVEDLTVDDGIVVNLDPAPMIVGGPVPSVVPPWKSTMLRNGTIASANRIAIIHVLRTTNLGGLTLQGEWDWFGNRLAKFPRTSPLYISRYDEIGSTYVDPIAFANQRTAPGETSAFRMRLNLWWAPADTDCSMHNEHPFLEIHTQIFGHGRIQKFLERDEQSLYEEISMAPGYTHDPFLHLESNGTPTYPWHRYYSDTDCIWLAIEFHPQTASAAV
ncbi:hypothetical protein QZM05_28640 [Burkholderia multivorans]|nr:hypothetical protein [Burkholderia multivorans]